MRLIINILTFAIIEPRHAVTRLSSLAHARAILTKLPTIFLASGKWSKIATKQTTDKCFAASGKRSLKPEF